ncbi:MAG: hypothetical protein WDN25_09750 [Acetobacteraceae bacterium]
MNSSDIASLLVAAAPLLAAAGSLLAAVVAAASLVVSLLNRRGQSVLRANQEEIKFSLDGNLKRMLATAKGVGEGVQQERDAAKVDAESLIATARGVAADLRQNTKP